VTVVTGSSAADLDSIVASIAYAYLLCREGKMVGSVFPYLPISRENLVLRTEVFRLFEREGVRNDTLVFADDVDLEDLLRAPEGELILVDTQGHELSPPLRGRIAEVIDHHPEDQPSNPVEPGTGVAGRPGGYPAENPAGPSSPGTLRRRILEPVGSACTLVAEQILHRKPELLDRQLATLLLAAVLLDTANLDPEAGRATDKDREIAGLLIQAGTGDAASLYEELVRARRDVAGVSSAQLLDKDYKERMAGSLRYGMSSVPVLIDTWRNRDEHLEEAFFGFLAEKALDLLVVLLYRQGDDFKRQLVICGTDEGLLNHVTVRLAEPLGLAELSGQFRGREGPEQDRPAGDRGAVIRGFSQCKSGESRKMIEPRLREILKNL
jgi:inorganic pyrophosphatase/exopolyphosphatase